MAGRGPDDSYGTSGLTRGYALLTGRWTSHVDPYEGCFVDSEVKARVTLQLAPVGRPSQPRVMIRLTTGAQGGASRGLVMSDDH